MSAGVSYGWSVLIPSEQGWYNPGAPLTDCIRPSRQSAMSAFVASWRNPDHDGLTVSQVWQRAYKRGWRLARVAVTPALGYRQ